MAENAAELFLLEAWVADNPGSRLFLKLAQAYRDAGQLQEAAGVLQRGLIMHPAMVEARLALAQVLEDMGDQESALTQLMSAAAELCRHAGVFNGLARIWDAQGRDDEAREAHDLGQALTQGLNGRFGGHLPAEPPSPMPPMPTAQASPAALSKPLEPPDPAAAGLGSSKLLEHLETMERAALKRLRG